MRTRIGWASAIAVLGLALTLAFAGAQGATAVQGQAVIAGQVNTETNETIVQNTNVEVPSCTQAPNGGLLGCGTRGVEGLRRAVLWGILIIIAGLLVGPGGVSIFK